MKKYFIPILVLFAFYARGTNLALNISSVSGLQGNYVIVPVKVASFNNILSMQGTIEFNASVVNYNSVQSFALPGLSASNFGISQSAAGKITFSWFDQDLSGETLTDSTVLFEVKFLLAGNPGQNSPVLLTGSVTPLEFTNTTYSVIPYTTLPGIISIIGGSSGALTFKIDSVQGVTNSQVSVPVRVYSFNNIVSIQGTVEFDPAKVSFVSTEQYGLTGMSASNFGISQSAAGKITFSWYDNTLAGVIKSDGYIVFALRFNLIGNAGTHSNVVMSGSVTPLEFIDNSLTALPYNLIPGNVNISNIVSQTLTLFGDSVTTSPSTQVVVPFRADNFRKIISMQGTLDFNTSIITYAGVEQFGLPGLNASNFGTSQTSSGKLTFSWYDQTLAGQTIPDSSVLFAVRYDVIGAIGQHSDINFGNIPTPVEVIDTSYNPVNTTLYKGHVEILNLLGVNINSISNDTLCVGDSIMISFTKWGTFNSGNIFTAQISDNTGSFASPVNIGSLASTTNGVIHGYIPLNSLQGTQYKIRIIASDPVSTSNPFSGSISIFNYPVAEAGSNVSVCLGDSVSLTASGGLLYHWSTSANLQSVFVSPIVTTKYFVTVTNSGGCSSIDSVVVSINSLPNGQVTHDTTICNGNSISLSASGGIDFHWSNNVNSAINTVNPTINTQYLVTITDANSCVDIDTVNVSVTTIIADAGVNQTSCAGSNVVLTASGGNSYYWSNGTAVSVNNVSPIVNTTYYVTVTGNNLCTNTDSVFVFINPLPVANASNDTSICIGNSVVLNATGGIQYHWSNGPFTQQNSVTPIVQTKYFVTVTDGNNCSSTDSVMVNVIALPTVTLNNDTSICSGYVMNLVAGGGVNYSWSNNIYTSTNIVSPTITTTYVVTVTDVFGCSNTDEVIITVNSTPADAGLNDTICKGETAVLNASGGVSYQWSGGLNTQSVSVNPEISTTYYVSVTSTQNCTAVDSVKIIVNQLPNAFAGNDTSVCYGNSLTISASGGAEYYWNNGVNTSINTIAPLLNTEYIVTVTDVNNCENTDTIFVTVNSLPVITISNDTAICMNEFVTLTASGGLSYEWSNSDNTNSIIVFPVNTTTYFVTITDINECSSTADVTVTVNNASADAGSNVTICSSDTILLSATGGFGYHWSTGENTQTIEVSPNSQLTFYVTITSSEGCVAFDSITVFVNPLPLAEAGNDVTICLGDTVFLTASGGVTYSWSNGIYVPENNVVPIDFTTYFVTVSDANNCFANDSVKVFVNSLPVINISNDTSVCRYEAVNITATGGVDYIWSTGANTQIINVVPLITTSYFVTVTDINGCSDTAGVNVLVLNTNVSAGDDTSICSGNTINLSASGGVSYIWNTGENTSAISVSPAIDSTYIVTITNADNCVASDSVTVYVHQIPVAEAGNDTSVCFGNFVLLSASGGLNYSWSNGANSQTVFVNADTTTVYYVTVSDNIGCSSIDSILVTFNPLPDIFAGSDTSICYGSIASLTASGGITYAWDNGSLLQTIYISPTVTTNYIVIGTDLNNCSNSDTVSVFVNFVNVFVGNDTSVCFGNDVILNASGGIQYIWSNGNTNAMQTVSPVSDSTFIVTVTTADNCSASDSITIFVNQNPVAFAGNDTSICFGNDLTFTASGGIQYNWSNGVNIAENTVTPVSSTSYSVVVTDINSCIGSDTVFVVVNSLPVVNLGDDTIFVSLPVTLDAGSGISNYLWSTNETTQTISVNSFGWYFVTVIDGNGCTSTDSIFVSDFVDVAGQNAESFSINIYPNPVWDCFYITNITEPFEVYVSDITGKNIIYRKLSNGINEINISVLSPGYYNVSVIKGNNISRKHIIKL